MKNLFKGLFIWLSGIFIFLLLLVTKYLVIIPVLLGSILYFFIKYRNLK